jgi:hypothetical protein
LYISQDALKVLTATTCGKIKIKNFKGRVPCKRLAQYTPIFIVDESLLEIQLHETLIPFNSYDELMHLLFAVFFGSCFVGGKVEDLEAVITTEGASERARVDRAALGKSGGSAIASERIEKSLCSSIGKVATMELNEKIGPSCSIKYMDSILVERKHIQCEPT